MIYKGLTNVILPMFKATTGLKPINPFNLFKQFDFDHKITE